MSKKEMSPRKRYVVRTLEMAKTDPQIGQLMPLPDVTEQASAEGLAYDKVIGIHLDAYAERPALGERSYEVVKDEAGTNVRNYKAAFQTTSYQELHEHIKAIAMTWRTHPKCQVSRDEFVLIMGFADVDFVTLDLACAYAKATTVPVQSSNSGADLSEIVKNIAPVLVAATVEDLPLATELAMEQKSVKSIVVFNYDERIDRERHIVQKAKQRIAREKHFFSISELIDFGKDESFSYLPDDENELDKRVAIIHSSGSTGKPKGAVIPQKAFINRWMGNKVKLPSLTVLLAPLNHIMGRMNLYAVFAAGGTGYFTLMPDMSTLLEDIRLARPIYLSLFPRIFELIYQYFQNEVARRHSPGETDRQAIEEAVKTEMRSTYLGDRLLCITFGAAPTSAKVQKFMADCFDVLMLEGYGSTESGTGSLTLEGKISKTVVSEYKLRDVPELGYFTTDKPYPRGEFLFKSKYGIKEYYKQPEATASLFDADGFSCTGDIVELIGEDEIRVIDRRKDVLKLSHGEYVATGALGTVFEAGSAVIKQIYVYGNSNRSYLLAVIFPEKKVLQQLLGDKPSNTQIKNLIRDELHKVAQKEDLKKFEVPRDYILAEEEFTQENGLLSSVRKRLRPALKRKYGAALEAIYEAHENAQDARLAALGDSDSTLTTVEKLIILLESQLNIEGIEAELPRNFVELGGDSLGAALYSASIAEIFDVSLPADAILSPTASLKSWANDIERAKANKAVGQATFNSIHSKGANVVHEKDLQLEKFLPKEILEHASNLQLAPAVPKTILLTGSNGFLGHILCLEYLKVLAKNGGKLICLIRANSDAAAYKKLANAYQGLDPELEQDFQKLAKNHLEVLAGDIGRPLLGLSTDNFSRLSTEVDRICHVAALVNHRLSYQHLFGPNVAGTAEIIRLALTETRKPIDFISTLGVFMHFDVDGWNVYEDTPFKSEISLTNNYAAGYATSKWASEILLRSVNEQFGNPIHIFRCDMILPDRHYKGQVNAPDMLTRLLYSIVHTGLAPQSFYRNRSSGNRKVPHYDGIPVDVLSKAIVGVHTQTPQNYKTYHALNYLKDTISLDRFVDWIASAGYTIDRMRDYQTWYERMETKLKALPEAQRKLSVLQVLIAYQKQFYGGPSSVYCTNFKQLIKDSLGELPPLSENYIHKYLGDLALLGMIPQPKKGPPRKDKIMKVNAYAALEAGADLSPYTYELNPLQPEQVDIKVAYCGICHSDLSMIKNEWRSSQYPLVPGHEIIGEVVAAGSAVKNVKVGDKVGLGWLAESCMSCYQCMDGSQHLCRDGKSTISGHGGFADYVRAHWAWAIPLPEGIDLSKAGPLLCGGITVFNPIIAAGVLPTDKVGVIGIGGLGHMAVKFLKYWGCEVVAFSSSESKREQILAMGASRVVNSRSKEELRTVAGQLDFIVNTTNVTLNWASYLKALAPKGRFFNVGIVLEPMAIPSGILIGGEKMIGGSPIGSPSLTSKMLEFCVRHNIYPDVEEFPIAQVNEALEHLEAGKARFRVVLKMGES